MASRDLVGKFKRYKIISDILTPESLAQLKRYLITGFSSAAVEFSLLYLFKEIFRLPLIEANSIALTIVFWFNFLLNRLWSFKSKNNVGRQLIMYGVLFLFNLAASDAIMYALTSFLHLQYLFAKALAIGAVVSWNFILYKKVIYK